MQATIVYRNYYRNVASTFGQTCQNYPHLLLDACWTYRHAKIVMIPTEFFLAPLYLALVNGRQIFGSFGTDSVMKLILFRKRLRT